MYKRQIQYSEKTLKTYQNAFEEFINYYREIDLKLIDEKMILEFMRYLVIERKVSESYQNQVCLLYTSDAADERSSVDLGGRRIIKKKKKE